jgi:Sporulation and spore germination
MRRTRRRDLVTAVGALMTLTYGISACGIPTGDDTFTEIPAEEDPFGLDQVASSTSTSTTLAAVPETTVFESTTTIAPLDDAQIYFLSRTRLQPVPILLSQEFGPDRVITALEDGPPAEGGAGLDTLIEPGLIVSAVVANGVMTVDLDAEIFSGIASFDQSEAIGQIVLTLLDNVRRVGGVLFTIGGEPVDVKKGNGLPSATGQPVTFDDYIELLGSTPASTSTTTTPPVDTTAPVPVETTVPG